MCTNFVPSARHEIAAARLGVLHLPPSQWPEEVFPGSLAPILVRGDVSSDEPVRCIVAHFGLVPYWCKDAQHAKDIARKTYNARSETASEKPSYRHPWHSRQWALAPMQCFFEPCWEDAPHNGGRSVRWQVGAADGDMLAVAGLWETWHNPNDHSSMHSFTLLTVNADGHPSWGGCTGPRTKSACRSSLRDCTLRSGSTPPLRMPANLCRPRQRIFCVASQHRVAALHSPLICRCFRGSVVQPLQQMR